MVSGFILCIYIHDTCSCTCVDELLMIDENNII